MWHLSTGHFRRTGCSPSLAFPLTSLVSGNGEADNDFMEKKDIFQHYRRWILSSLHHDSGKANKQYKEVGNIYFNK